VHSAGEIHEFDDLICACRLKEVGKLLDFPEKELFNREKYNPYCATALAAEGVPHNGSTTQFINALHEPGDPSLIFRYWPEKNIYTATAYMNNGITTDLVIERLKSAIKEIGGTLTEVKAQIVWDLFPHVAPADILDGYYDQIESLQGKNHIYFTGSSFTFDTVEDVVLYSKELVDRFF
jgi:hypothetical protein